MTNPQTPPQTAPGAVENPPALGGAWKPITDAALGEGKLSVDPDGLRRCIKLCEDHALAMGEIAERAKRELRVDVLGIGEAKLESAKLLMQKFNDKAVGGGQIAFSSSAVGLFRAHESYARDMKSTFEAVLRAYELQEGIITGNLEGIGGIV